MDQVNVLWQQFLLAYRGLDGKLGVGLLLWLLLWVAYAWRKISVYGALRRNTRRAATLPEGQAERAPYLSVLIVLGNQGRLLKENLPHIFQQQYPSFEVIVVDEGTDSENSDLLLSLQRQYAQLRCTYVPASTRYISRRKLAITLGVRAAKGEWIVLTEPDACPTSDHWLMHLSACMSERADFVLGYANYEESNGLFSRRARFERFLFHSLCCRAVQRGFAAGADGCNLAFRRSAFLEHKGFSGQVELLRGEDLQLVSSQGRRDNVALCYRPAAGVHQTLGIKSIWRSEQLARLQAIRHLPSRARRWWQWHDISLVLSWGYWLLPLALLGMWCKNQDHLAEMTSQVELWAVFAPLLVMWLVTPLCLLRLLQRSTRSVGERPFGLYPLWYDAMRTFRRPWLELRRWSHRRSFYRH